MERQPCRAAATSRRPENTEGPSRPAPVKDAGKRRTGSTSRRVRHEAPGDDRVGRRRPVAGDSPKPAGNTRDGAARVSPAKSAAGTRRTWFAVPARTPRPATIERREVPTAAGGLPRPPCRRTRASRRGRRRRNAAAGKHRTPRLSPRVAPGDDRASGGGDRCGRIAASVWPRECARGALAGGEFSARESPAVGRGPRARPTWLWATIERRKGGDRRGVGPPCPSAGEQGRTSSGCCIVPAQPSPTRSARSPAEW